MMLLENYLCHVLISGRCDLLHVWRINYLWHFADKTLK